LITENEFRRELLGLDDIDGGDLRVGAADTFAETIGNQVNAALAQRGDVFQRNGKTKLLTR
ncbi:MAG: hypothetical protein IIA67_04490, partial [Planctomycetes bacterium]|nr:hypothetical protein [Planctomycetota bacterium]